MSYPSDLFRAIFTPGTPPALLIATNVSFACLQLTLLVMLFVTGSFHFFFLSLTCVGLWGGINWFVREVEALRRVERQATEIRRVQTELAKEHTHDVEDNSESDELLDATHSTGYEVGGAAGDAERRKVQQQQEEDEDEDEDEDDFEKVEKEEGYETEGKAKKTK
ncbi:hypothetical protein DRE_04027 [Drechslerella stenobrocha 248]|uniref:SMK killer toxin resistance protein n=1 Tax=Drechslerella stenobrocha 248 TaxID=1043628 RepID=W7I2Z4_9PEZI|nr:hypothetical protein DRE_04027 [Drechslerella stenobrocha 248]